MIENLPRDLKETVKDEEVDFVTQAKKDKPFVKKAAVLVFALIWNFFLSGLLAPVFIGLFRGSFKSKISFKDDIEIAIIVTAIFFALITIGLGSIIYFFIITYQKGGLFIATNKRLIKYRNKNIISKDWNQFTGSTQISKRKYDHLALELKTGKFVRQNNSSFSQFKPDIIHMVGIDNVSDIEGKCRNRIYQNEETIKPTK